MSRKFPPRFLLGFIGLACVGILTTAWYLQYGPDRQQPCPLCVLQRYTFLTLALVCLLAAANGPQRTGMLVYAGIADLLASSGLGLAIWQVTKGGSMTSCLSDPVGEFVNGLPPANWWPEYFFANGGCADKYPPFLGLHAPEWSLVWFTVFTGLIMAAFITLLRQRRTA